LAPESEPAGRDLVGFSSDISNGRQAGNAAPGHYADGMLDGSGFSDETPTRVARTPVGFRFHLTNGRLYSFWVSPDASGASHGCVAAGGPGLTGPTDTVGAAAYRR
jgi:hypothetical protein